VISAVRQTVQTLSGVHLSSYSMGTGGFFPAVKRPGRETDHSSLSNAEVKNEWSCTSTYRGVHTDIFTFTWSSCHSAMCTNN